MIGMNVEYQAIFLVFMHVAFNDRKKKWQTGYTLKMCDLCYMF